MQSLHQSGRIPVVITVVFVVAIGLLGALLLPRLLHEPPEAPHRGIVGQICLLVPQDTGLPTAWGAALHVTAEASGRTALDVTERLPAGATEAAVLERIEDAVRNAGWHGLDGAHVVGACLELGPVTAVGLSLGHAGVPAMVGLAGDGTDVIEAELRLEGGPETAPDEAPPFRLTLRGRGLLASAGEAIATRDAAIEVPVGPAGALLDALRDRLVADGWSAERVPDALVIHQLPEHGPLSTLLAILDVPADGDAPPPWPPYRLTLRIR